MLIDAIPEAILLVRADGTIARANSLAERMFGYAPDALHGRPVSDLMPAAGRDAHTGHIQRYLASPTVRPMGAWQNLLATRHDGSEFPVDIALGSVTEDGELMAVASIRDTTEARRAERQARLREHQLHVSMELARIGTWEFNPVRDTRTFSPGMMALLQRAEPFRSSAEFFAAVHPDDRESIRARMGRAIATGEPYRVVLRMLRADGVTLSLDSHVSTERDAAGRVELLRGVVMDVTEHLAAQERLQQSTQNFQRMIEMLPDALLVQGAGGILFANPRALTLLGVSSLDALIGRSVRSFVHPLDVARLDRTLDDLKGEVVRAEAAAWRVQRPDGTTRAVEVTLIPLVWNQLPAQGLVARDVTEESLLREQLQHSDRMAAVGMLAAGVGHEINNPMTAIEANLRHALECVVSPGDHCSRAEVGQALRDASEAATRVTQIVRDLKVFARSADDRTEAVDVHRAVHAALRLSQSEVRHRARVTLDLRAVPRVRASEARLCQVLVNLVVNAAQAIPEGHAGRNEITITTELTPDGRVSLSVRDTGHGISDEDRQRLFLPFFTTKPVGEGTGLGLSICHRIITSFGGTIEVESATGVGTLFRVQLLAAVEPKPTSASPEAPSDAPSARARVLVIDDEALVGASIVRVLRRSHDATHHESALSALSALRAGERFDLILCDLTMPQMSGEQFYMALREEFPAMLERVVITTGGAFTAQAQQFLAREAPRVLEKPIDATRLRALVRSFLPAD